MVTTLDIYVKLCSAQEPNLAMQSLKIFNLNCTLKNYLFFIQCESFQLIERSVELMSKWHCSTGLLLPIGGRSHRRVRISYSLDSMIAFFLRPF